MKKSLKLIASALVIATGVNAAPFLALSDNAEVFLLGSLSYRADDNIFLNPVGQSDGIFTFDPGLELVFGNSSTLSGKARVQESIVRYYDFDGLDSDLFSARLDADYDGGKTTGAFNLSYVELNQNTVDVIGLDSLIRRNVFSGGATGEHQLSEKTSFAAGVSYGDTDYRVAGFADATTFEIPLHAYYEVTPKVDLGLGYRHRNTWLLFGNDSEDNFFSASTRGEFTPKLTGSLDVGVTQRSFDTGPSHSMLGVDGNLSYALTPKTTMQLNASRDFNVNSQAQQQKNTSIGSFLTASISEEFSATAGLSYRKIDYYRPALGDPARSDEYVEAMIGATYTLNSVVRFGANYAYRQNFSELATSDFIARVLTLSVSVRY